MNEIIERKKKSPQVKKNSLKKEQWEEVLTGFPGPRRLHPRLQQGRDPSKFERTKTNSTRGHG